MGRVASSSTGTTRAPTRSSRDADVVATLDLLRQRRAPYADLLTEIVARTLTRFRPVAGKTIVEIGAGTGQLRDWLSAAPGAIGQARILHTEPKFASLRGLKDRSPDAAAALASAQALPFADGVCGAMLGLCVFDAMSAPEQAAAVRECARVLAPGGRFVHFLDMATLLEAPFEKLAAAGLVPIPNVFGDPTDHEWPLDIVLVKRDWLAGLLDFALRTRHPLAAEFGGDLAMFLTAPPKFDVTHATNCFKAVASDSAKRSSLSTLLRSASRSAFQWGYPPIDPLSFHSAKYFASVLESAFLDDGGSFRVEQCEILNVSKWKPRTSDDEPKYRSLCVGHQRLLAQLPSRLLDANARHPPIRPDGTAGDPEAEVLHEVGVLVFVAQRVP